MTAEGINMQLRVQSTGDRWEREQNSRPGPGRDEGRRRNLHLVKLTVACLTLAVSAALALSVVTVHLGVRAVLTGSMRPDFGPGAALLTERIAVDAIKPGMIVLFVPPGEHNEYAHRVTSVTLSKTGPIITTKGDANKAIDPWHAKLVTPYANQVIGSVPGIGRVFVGIRGIGQIVLAVLGGIVAAWAGSRWILSSRRTAGRQSPAVPYDVRLPRGADQPTWGTHRRPLESSTWQYPQYPQYPQHPYIPNRQQSKPTRRMQ